MIKSALAASAAALLLSAGSASAATRLVDDDGLNCPGATFQTIQSAIDAAVPGDTVRVCDGIYHEQVVIPASKPGLRLRSDNGGATVQSPPGGLTPMADPGFGYGASLALLTVDAPRTIVSDMAFTGPIVAADQAAACEGADFGELRVAAVALRAERAFVADSVIGPASFPCESGRDFAGIAVYPPAGIVLDHNSISSVTIGIESLGGNATALRNFIQGTRSGVRAADGGTTTLRSNDLLDNTNAVEARFSVLRAIGNRVRGNVNGFSLDDGIGGEVRNNFVDDNFNGIIVGFIGQAGLETGVTIRANRVRGSENIGIGVLGGPRGGGNVLRDNSSLGSGVYDCLDDTSGDGTSGTGNVWTGNVGVIDFPNVCSKP